MAITCRGLTHSNRISTGSGRSGTHFCDSSPHLCRSFGETTLFNAQTRGCTLGFRDPKSAPAVSAVQSSSEFCFS
jgi:hypothetical protein